MTKKLPVNLNITDVGLKSLSCINTLQLFMNNTYRIKCNKDVIYEIKNQDI